MSLEEMERRALGLSEARRVSDQPRRHAVRAHAVAVDLSRGAATGAVLERGSADDVRRAPGAAPREHRGRGARNAGRLGAAWAHDVRVNYAVYASCALPGFFPPGRVDGRVHRRRYDRQSAVAIAAQHADAVIAVDVGSSDLSHNTDASAQGFAATYMRAATVMMHALQVSPLSQWSGPPMFLIRPRLGHVGWLSFSHTPEVMAEGYRAAREAMAQLPECLAAKGGVYPRAAYRLSVDRDLCTGCGFCAAIAPNVMGMDSRGKAYAKTEIVDWCSADGDFVRHCPTDAITATRLTPASDQPIAQQEVA